MQQIVPFVYCHTGHRQASLHCPFSWIHCWIDSHTKEIGS